MQAGEKRAISSKEWFGHRFNYYSPNAVKRYGFAFLGFS
jgi:hypothetical protein